MRAFYFPSLGETTVRCHIPFHLSPVCLKHILLGSRVTNPGQKPLTNKEREFKAKTAVRGSRRKERSPKRRQAGSTHYSDKY